MRIHATTVLSIRRGEQLAIAGDGQVTVDRIVAKADAIKIRKLEAGGHNNAGVLLGFAGTAADAFSLMERFESKLKDSPGNITGLCDTFERNVERRASDSLPQAAHEWP